MTKKGNINIFYSKSYIFFLLIFLLHILALYYSYKKQKKWVIILFINDYVSFILNNFNLLQKKQRGFFKKIYTKISTKNKERNALKMKTKKIFHFFFQQAKQVENKTQKKCMTIINTT